MGVEVKLSLDWQALTDISKKLVVSTVSAVQEDHPETNPNTTLPCTKTTSFSETLLSIH
jgi:hypothetical protein